MSSKAPAGPHASGHCEETRTSVAVRVFEYVLPVQKTKCVGGAIIPKGPSQFGLWLDWSALPLGW